MYVASRLMTLEMSERIRVEAPWLFIAFKERNVKETRGLPGNNPRILEYLSTVPGLKNIPHKMKVTIDGKSQKVNSGFKLSDVDETSWCACFVKWCLQGAGVSTLGMSASAQSWERFGTPLLKPRLGAITVIYKKPSSATARMTSSGYHVSFYAGGPPNNPTLFGGNQDNRVCAKEFPGHKVMAYRWPSFFMPAWKTATFVA